MDVQKQVFSQQLKPRRPVEVKLLYFQIKARQIHQRGKRVASLPCRTCEFSFLKAVL